MFRSETTNTDSLSEQQNNTNESSSSFKYLPPIDQPLCGPDWLTIEENLVLLVIAYLPLIAPDFIASPDSKTNDGDMHMFFIKEGVTRAQLLRLFQEAELGTHLKSDLVEYVRIKAFRLEPIPLDNKVNSNYMSDGVMMIDGERVPYGVVQGEIMPSMGNVLANMNK